MPYFVNTLPCKIQISGMVFEYSNHFTDMSLGDLIRRFTFLQKSEDINYEILLHKDQIRDWYAAGGLNSGLNVHFLEAKEWKPKEKMMICSAYEQLVEKEFCNWSRFVPYRRIEDLVNAAYKWRLHQLIMDNVPYGEAAERADNFARNAKPEKLLGKISEISKFKENKFIVK